MTNLELLKNYQPEFIYIWDDHYYEKEDVYDLEELISYVENFNDYTPKLVNDKLYFVGTIEILGIQHTQIVTAKFTHSLMKTKNNKNYILGGF